MLYGKLFSIGLARLRLEEYQGVHPVVYLIIRHKIEDFAKWKPAFDMHGSMRERSGCKGGQLFRESGDANSMVILFEWDNIDNATNFVESADLKEAMGKAGVIGKPEFFFLDQIEDFPV